ncbi:hypothetical protein IY145_21205 [Methylosinus sp. H3A]|uniref:hypothetical protein n=1 Tax=Methylosinus sp. H3A TaxID=2785786 RepID=UPI0018C31847|nr:hypothetical protein [Methylosinus sp. H3A]MBG0811870.1 hypothetical protein [Methylosinus sp. H3A]
MLRDLAAADALVRALKRTAPRAVAAAGGAAALVAWCGAPTGAQFWSLRPFPERLWEAMAGEHQAASRSNVGDNP